MKQADIKRLEKAVELYKKIEVVLDKACDSIDNQPREWHWLGLTITLCVVRFGTVIIDKSHQAINNFKEKEEG